MLLFHLCKPCPGFLHQPPLPSPSSAALPFTTRPALFLNYVHNRQLCDRKPALGLTQSSPAPPPTPVHTRFFILDGSTPTPRTPVCEVFEGGQGGPPQQEPGEAATEEKKCKFFNVAFEFFRWFRFP